MITQSFGAVASNGTTAIAGSGDWAVKKVSVGAYEVTFSKPFAAQPVVVASGYMPIVQGGAASDNTFSVGPIQPGSFLVRTFDVESKSVDNAGEAQDAPFTGIAIGAQ
ncbi:MAG: hypothetical protein U0350_46985 [Caldilineaceae bacterium]